MVSSVHDPGTDDQDGDQGNETMVVPLTQCRELRITERKVLPHLKIEARVEIRDTRDGRLERYATVLADRRSPFLLMGAERLHIDPQVEQQVRRLLFDPTALPDVLAVATDGGQPVPPLPPLPYPTDLIVKVIDYGYRAGEKAGYAAGLRDGMMGRAVQDRPAQAATAPQAPIPPRPGRFDYGRKAGWD